MRPGEQVLLMPEKAHGILKFTGYEAADHTVYCSKKKPRDLDAGKAFLKEPDSDGLNGIYMRDILREGDGTG